MHNTAKKILAAAAVLILAFCLTACEKETVSKYLGLTQSTDNISEYRLTFDVSPENSGYISGIAVQTLIKGELSTTVEAVAAPGYSFVEWSDGKSDPVRRKIKIAEDTELTAIFKKTYDSCPELYLTTSTGRDVYSKTKYVDCTLSVDNVDPRYQLDEVSGTVKGRGNASWGWEKKSYSIKLSESQRLCGLGKGKSKNWALISNHCDQSLMRNYTAFWLQKQLSGIPWSPDCRLVDLYLNGEYQGNYMLIEKISVNENKINILKPEQAGRIDAPFLLELDNYAGDSGPLGINWFTVKGYPYQIKGEDSPSEKRNAYIDEVMTVIYDILLSGSKTDICAVIDIDSAVDAYLLEEISKNIDCGWSSFYLYMGSDDKLYIGPAWDFDLAFGNDFRLDNGGYEKLYAGKSNGFSQQNPWFLHLMKCPWFEEMAVKRFNELYDSGVFEEMIEEIDRVWKNCGGSIEKNFERWPIFGWRLNQEPESVMSLNSAEQHVNYLKQWIANRIMWLADYFNG